MHDSLACMHTGTLCTHCTAPRALVATSNAYTIDRLHCALVPSGRSSQGKARQRCLRHCRYVSKLLWGAGFYEQDTLTFMTKVRALGIWRVHGADPRAEPSRVLLFCFGFLLRFRSSAPVVLSSPQCDAMDASRAMPADAQRRWAEVLSGTALALKRERPARRTAAGDASRAA